MNIFKPEPFRVTSEFAESTLLKTGEIVESFERVQLKIGLNVLAHKHGEQTRGIITKIEGNNVLIDDKEIAISDIMFIIT